MAVKHEIKPDETANGKRLDVMLSAELPELSRAFLQKLIRDGKVAVDGQIVTLPRFILKNVRMITVDEPEAPALALTPGKFAFEIIYEDDAMLVINKPAGVVVHPGAGNSENTVVNALLDRYPGIDELFPGNAGRPGIVHRLDKDTSGCLVIAKTPEALFKLGEAFANHTACKCYLAICRGIPQEKSGSMETLIGRHPVNRQKMAIVEKNGKTAITSYEIVSAMNVDGIDLALAKVRIATGRTHQIRVHMSSINLPVAGDTLYGRHTGFPGVERQLLHAWKLSLPHPQTGELMEFTSPVPEDFARVSALLKVRFKQS